MGMKTERFSVSLPPEELPIINKFANRKGVSRNELMRRATLSFILSEDSGFTVPVQHAWEEIGSADDIGSLFDDGEDELEVR